MNTSGVRERKRKQEVAAVNHPILLTVLTRNTRNQKRKVKEEIGHDQGVQVTPVDPEVPAEDLDLEAGLLGNQAHHETDTDQDLQSIGVGTDQEVDQCLLIVVVHEVDPMKSPGVSLWRKVRNMEVMTGKILVISYQDGAT